MIVLSASQIVSGLKQIGYPAESLVIMDNSYALIDEDKASDFFSQIANEVIGIFGSAEPERKDCDKYCKLAQCIATLSHVEQTSKDAGLGFGTILYRMDPTRGNGGHGLSAILTAKDGKMRVRTFDPQTGFEYGLLPSEILNTRFFIL